MGMSSVELEPGPSRLKHAVNSAFRTQLARVDPDRIRVTTKRRMGPAPIGIVTLLEVPNHAIERKSFLFRALGVAPFGALLRARVEKKLYVGVGEYDGAYVASFRHHAA